MSRREPVSVIPFLEWVERRLAKLRIDVDGPSAEAALREQIGWPGDSGQRRLHRWRFALLTDTVERAGVEDALDRAGIGWWEIYGEDGEAAAEAVHVTAFCPACDEDCVPMDDGTCGWCGTQTGGAEVAEPSDAAREYRLGTACRCGGAKARGAMRCRDCYAADQRGTAKRDPATGRMIRTIPPEAHRCACGSKKQPTARTCWPCYAANGSHTGRRHRKGARTLRAIDEDTLLEARRLYAAGRSMRAVAADLLPRTDYKNPASAAASLFELFRAREWPLRDRAAATSASNRRRHEELPRCSFTTAKGRRCNRHTGRASGTCWHHDPENLQASLADLREREAVAA